MGQIALLEVEDGADVVHCGQVDRVDLVHDGCAFADVSKLHPHCCPDKLPSRLCPVTRISAFMEQGAPRYEKPHTVLSNRRGSARED